MRTDVVIWWIGESERDKISVEDLEAISKYIADCFKELRAHNGHEILWADKRFGSASCHWDNESFVCQGISEAGVRGIFVTLEDARRLPPNAGFFTDLECVPTDLECAPIDTDV